MIKTYNASPVTMTFKDADGTKTVWDLSGPTPAHQGGTLREQGEV